MLVFDSPVSKIERVMILAKGGMGTVEAARVRQGPIQRLCAVKRIHSQYADDAEFLAMFREEARLAGLISHPNVVRVLAAGSDAEGAYLIMDYVEGVSANGLLKQIASVDARLPIPLVIEIARQTAAGLSAAHELTDSEGKLLSLIHRDVSPQNILIGLDGLVRLTDFGIAKALDSRTQTNTGYLKGKQGYMAPEQLQFRTPDQRTDLFAFGVVVFELFSGNRLYGGNMIEAARAILDKPVPDIMDYREDVPNEIAELLFELLAKESVDRPGSARGVAERLRIIGEDLLEPTPALGAYVSEHFGSELEGRRLEIQGRIADLRQRRSLAPPITAGRGLVFKSVMALSLTLPLALTGYWLLRSRDSEPTLSTPVPVEQRLPPSPVPVRPPPAAAELATPPADATATEVIVPSASPRRPIRTMRQRSSEQAEQSMATQAPGLLAW